MRVVEETRRLQERADQVRAAGRRIALVPTMGALHEGHLSLVRACREDCQFVGATIFGYVFFNEFPDLLSWLGIAIIVGSGIYIAAREAGRRRAN